MRPEFYDHIGLAIDQSIRALGGGFFAVVDAKDPTDAMVQTAPFIVVKEFYKPLCAATSLAFVVVLWRSARLMLRRL